MIYLDNSSTTHTKPLSVKMATIKGILKENINPSRGNYRKAISLAQKIYNCREIMAEYFGTVPDNVIFTSGCTEALNLAIRGTAQRNGHIITTIFEHNSVLRVLESLKSTHNISYTTLTPNKNGKILKNFVGTTCNNNF